MQRSSTRLLRRLRRYRWRALESLAWSRPQATHALLFFLQFFFGRAWRVVRHGACRLAPKRMVDAGVLGGAGELIDRAGGIGLKQTLHALLERITKGQEPQAFFAALCTAD